MTCVSGFETFGLSADSVAEELETACDSSATVQPDPKNPEVKEIVVRGEDFKAVVACLITMGIPRRWIEVTKRELRKPR